MTRVLHAVAGLTAAAGGPSRCIPLLCAGLATAGGDVGVITPYGPGEADLASEAAGLPAQGVQLLAMPRTSRTIAQLLARWDLVHVNGCWTPFLQRVHHEARRLNLPVVLSPHGMLEPWALTQKRLMKALAWYLYQGRSLRSSSVLHATADMEALRLRELRLRNPIAVVANPVEIPDLSTLGTPSRKQGRVRRALFLSRVHPKKGIDLLLRAWSMVRPQGWELVIGGPGEAAYLSELRNLASSLGVAAAVSFPGSIDGEAKWQLYRSSDLFVLPTHSENFGIVVAEALAAEVPVITTRGAPWAELPARGCGWWIPVATDALEVALREALALTDDQRAEMGAIGRRYVEAAFSPTNTARSMLEVYQWVLGNAPIPPESVQLAEP